MRAFVSCLAVLWLTAMPGVDAIHGLYTFGQHELLYKKNNCKQIPANLLLCNDIEYADMRLPNLLGHETMNEVLQQASSWIPLVQKQCHPDTRKFLCSLFAPVCLDDLDEPIQPCRSLCEGVRSGCAPVMSAFGFPWPKMLDCDRFPLDNDLCIPPASAENVVPATRGACASTRTVERAGARVRCFIMCVYICVIIESAVFVLVPTVCDACKETDENDNEIVDNLCKNDFGKSAQLEESCSVGAEADEAA